MTDTIPDKIFCVKLKQEAKALNYPPMPGEIGKKIQAQISEEAWRTWLGQQTMLVNEYRLNLLEQEARSFLMKEMQKFLFGEEE